MNNRYKFSMILMLVLMICCISVASVSAEDLSVSGNFTNLKNNVSGSHAGDTIYFVGNVTLNDGESFSNGITINKDLTIDGKGHTINATSQNGNKAAVFVINNKANVILKNLIITGAYKTGNGAVVNLEANCKLTVINCTFIDNIADVTDATDKINGKGGVIYTAVSSTLTATDSRFISNVANSRGSGGGSAIYALGNINLDSCTFNLNNATSEGGTIYSKADVTITNSVFNDNFGNAAGGAVAIENTNSKSFISVCNFTSNVANSTSTGGGAIVNWVT